MPPSATHRDREPTQRAILEALVERPENGMSVLELRAEVDADIDHIEEALSALQEDALIDTDRRGDRVVIQPTDRALPEDPSEAEERGFVDAIRERFGL